MSECEYSVLVNGCDKHFDLIPDFFKLFIKYWSSCDAKVILNTESMSYENSSIDLINLHIPDSRSWSDRLIQSLEHIDTEYVIIMLDDFYIESAVKTDMIKKCIEWMNADRKIACFSFKNTPCGKEPSKKFKDYAELKVTDSYRFNCQIGIWRVRTLKKLLRPHEDAWHFERYSGYRSFRMNIKSYSILESVEGPFDYNWGKLNYRGKLNLSEIERLKEKTGITIIPKRETIETICNTTTPSVRSISVKKLINLIKSML